MQTWRDSVQKRASHSEKYPQSCSVTQLKAGANATAMQAMKAMPAMHSSGAAQVRGRVARRGASTRGKTLGGEKATATARNGRTWPTCTAHRALVRAVAVCVAEWYLIDREEARFGQGLGQRAGAAAHVISRCGTDAH